MPAWKTILERIQTHKKYKDKGSVSEQGREAAIVLNLRDVSEQQGFPF